MNMNTNTDILNLSIHCYRYASQADLPLRTDQQNPYVFGSLQGFIDKGRIAERYSQLHYQNGRPYKALRINFGKLDYGLAKKLLEELKKNFFADYSTLLFMPPAKPLLGYLFIIPFDFESGACFILNSKHYDAMRSFLAEKAKNLASIQFAPKKIGVHGIKNRVNITRELMRSCSTEDIKYLRLRLCLDPKEFIQECEAMLENVRKLEELPESRFPHQYDLFLDFLTADLDPIKKLYAEHLVHRLTSKAPRLILGKCFLKEMKRIQAGEETGKFKFWRAINFADDAYHALAVYFSKIMRRPYTPFQALNYLLNGTFYEAALKPMKKNKVRPELYPATAALALMRRNLHPTRRQYFLEQEKIKIATNTQIEVPAKEENAPPPLQKNAGYSLRTASFLEAEATKWASLEDHALTIRSYKTIPRTFLQQLRTYLLNLPIDSKDIPINLSQSLTKEANILSTSAKELILTVAAFNYLSKTNQLHLLKGL